MGKVLGLGEGDECFDCTRVKAPMPSVLTNSIVIDMKFSPALFPPSLT